MTDAKNVTFRESRILNFAMAFVDHYKKKGQQNRNLKLYAHGMRIGVSGC